MVRVPFRRLRKWLVLAPEYVFVGAGGWLYPMLPSLSNWYFSTSSSVNISLLQGFHGEQKKTVLDEAMRGVP
jgi:hypothetical protein